MGARRASTRPYATLEPRVTNVSEAAIRKKWKKLPESSQTRLSQVLEGVQRQGLAKITKKRKDGVSVEDGQGDEVVKDVAERLTRRLPRMPFPPRTDERDFDFEGTLQRVRMLETILTSNIHSIGLLKGQIKKEEEMLEKDRQELETLEEGRRSNQALRKRQAQNLHPLAKYQPEQDDNDPGNRNPASAMLPIDLDLQGDGELRELVEQLGSHLESMQNNTGGTRDIIDAVNDAQSKVDLFTATALNPKQYERLYGRETG